MSNDRNPSDRDIEQLFLGNDVDPDLQVVAEWVAAVRSAADAPVVSSLAAEHVAALAQAAAARVPPGQALGTVRARSSPVFAKFYRSFAARAAAIASALVLMTTGIAAAGVLPDGVQEPVADVYSIFGFDFHPDDDDDGSVGGADDDVDEGDENGEVGVQEEVIGGNTDDLEDAGVGEVEDNDTNEPEDNDTNEPEDNDTNEPEDNDTNEPEDNDTNEPEDNDSDDSEDNDSDD